MTDCSCWSLHGTRHRPLPGSTAVDTAASGYMHRAGECYMHRAGERYMHRAGERCMHSAGERCMHTRTCAHRRPTHATPLKGGGCVLQLAHAFMWRNPHYVGGLCPGGGVVEARAGQEEGHEAGEVDELAVLDLVPSVATARRTGNMLHARTSTRRVSTRAHGGTRAHASKRVGDAEPRTRTAMRQQRGVAGVLRDKRCLRGEGKGCCMVWCVQHRAGGQAPP